MEGDRFSLVEKLAWLKLRARRRGVWFTVLRRIDRVLIDVTIEVTGRVRSSKLAEQLLSVITRVEDALENRVCQALRKIGFPIARRLSLLAQKWGNRLAERWALDLSFARFLAIMQIDDHRV
jgi:hypothetical protein